MTTREARYLVLLTSTETLSVIPQFLLIVQRFGMVLGRVYTRSPQETLLEVVGVMGKNYDAFLAEVRGKYNAEGLLQIQKVSAQTIQEEIGRSQIIDIVTPSTLALVKPHILHNVGQTSALLQSIMQEQSNGTSFQITAMMTIHLTIAMAEELFDAYRGIVSDYLRFIENICSGPVLAVVISCASTGTQNAYGEEVDIVSAFREFVGPINPKVAKVLRPKSLRAIYGVNSLDNALHCTDLPEDGEMECRYLFETLASLK